MSTLWGKYPWIDLERISDPEQECSKGVSDTHLQETKEDEDKIGKLRDLNILSVYY